MNFDLTLDPYLYAAFVALSILLLAFLVFRSTRVHEPRMRVLLFALRAAALAILLLILADPVIQRTQEEERKREHHLFLVDTSESMGVGTPRTRLQRTLAIVESLLAEPAFGADASLVSFDERLHLQRESEGRSNPAPLAATGESTYLGTALVSLIQSTRELGVAGIVVCSDGRIHDRNALSDAVRLARRHDIPISTLLADNERGLFNLNVRNCLVERRAAPGARLPVRVMVGAQGSAGEELFLRVTDDAGKVAAQETFTATEGLTEQTLFLKMGDRPATYTLELSPIAGELSHLDNTYAFKVDVTDPRIRVIYMEGSHHRDDRWGRWEWEFLEEAFRETGNIDLDILTVDVQQEVGGRLYNIKTPSHGYPETRQELFRYDVVICSDINKYIFSDDQLKWTAELVSERGGGFCMIGGITAFGAGGWDETVWEKMIPVDMKTFSEGHVFESFTPEIPEKARKHPLWQMDADPERSAEIIAAHPPLLGTNLVNRAKPAATTLATHPLRDMPVICVQPYGKGRSMAFTSDAAGGWGLEYQTQWGEGGHDNRHYRKFWVNAVKWLAENSLGRRRKELVGGVEGISYKPGDVVKVHARPLNALEKNDLRASRVTARLELPGVKAVELRLDTDRQEFRGQLKLPDKLARPEVKIAFNAVDAERMLIGEDRVPIQILQMKREFTELRPDPQIMAQLARVTGGKVLKDRADLEALLREKEAEQEKNRRHFKVPLWDHAWLWALLLFLLSAEWLTRKLLRFA